MEKPFLFYLGVIEPRKNIPAIIKAFNILKAEKDFKDLQLVIAGSKGWLYDKSFPRSQKFKIPGRNYFLGAATPSEALFLYNLAEVLFIRRF